MKNTQPEFFENWGFEALMKECARLNQILDEAQKDADKVIAILKGDDND